jgi:VIT1/CCC1 family predicted Fe2+/Mn2+ transporter
VTAYWRRVRSGVKAKDFFEYYAAIETHLADREILQIEDGCAAIDAQTAAVTDQMTILAKVSHGRFRHPAILEHDVKHRMLVQRLRGTSHRTFSNAGFWFLTHDSVLPRYDHVAADGANSLAFCVSAGSWYQIMEAFRPKTDDPEQSLADMLASPYVRFRRPMSQKTILEVVARVEQYTDGSPELATKVLMNSAAIEEIERTSDEERTAAIDDAIVEAARKAQEEARDARALAEEERQRAAIATEEARARAAEVERRAAEKIALAKTAQAAELAAAEARRQEAVRREEERSQRALREAEERHRRELSEREKKAQEAERASRSARRRLILVVAVIAAAAAFFALDLAVGLKTAWSVIVALSVLVGLWLALSGWARHRASGD